MLFCNSKNDKIYMCISTNIDVNPSWKDAYYVANLSCKEWEDWVGGGEEKCTRQVKED